ncbi:Protein kinase domain [Popillia japonica]|uniref:Protein kinase domain n=1 Tax=Popillia japonica TaxID=7064 RepID=A0AAW1MFE5_POPJA
MNVAKFFKKYKFSAESNDSEILQKMGYTIEKSIGEGTYSKVCLATMSLRFGNEKVACKIINKKCAGQDFIKKFLPRELKIIRYTTHPNIITVHDIIEINSTIYIFMDYCRNGDLLEYIKNHGPLCEDKAKRYFRQLTSAVQYLHALEIAHRDLKCENIFLTINNSIKLGDFGFARHCIDDLGECILSDTFCGSAAYAAPEILQGISYNPKMYDMWSLGCILYIMLTASMPFDDTNIKRMLKSQLNRSLCIAAFKYWKKNCHHLKSLLAYLLEPNVMQRATIDEVVNCSWLKESSKNNKDNA